MAAHNPDETCCGCSTDDNQAQSSIVDTADQADDTSRVSEFIVSKMDCPSEERLIRMAFEDIQPSLGFKFDIPERKVWIYHGDAKNQAIDEIEKRMQSLGLGAQLLETKMASSEQHSAALASDVNEAKILKILLAINALMFVLELTLGWWAQSTGLIADSLDMFADAAVYGLALYAVGRSAHLKLRSAQVAGWLQALLAIATLAEVLRRFFFGSEPISSLMMTVGLIALIANIACLLLIAKNREGGIHMKASYIFSANDVIANAGVIVAGFLVAQTGSAYPDLVIGSIIALIVLNGARRILKLS